MLLSIIIPVYNLEDYISSCLDSILSQDFRDYELLLINDGSTDRTGYICDYYAKMDSRIKVYHQNNSGVSAARNLGIEKATGKWICFIDGDDQIEKDSFSVILAEAEKNNPEILIAKSYHYNNGIKEREKYPFDGTFLNKSFTPYELITEKLYKRGSVWGVFYSRKFIRENKLYFPLGIENKEDGIFISLCYLFAMQISFVAADFYLVTEREGSASRSWDTKKIFKMIDNIRFLNNYLEKHTELSGQQKEILHYNIYDTISAIFNQLYYCFSFENYLKLTEEVRIELNGKIETGKIPISKGKIRLLNFSLNLYSIATLTNQWFRQLLK